MDIQAKTPIFILAGGLGTRISEETLLKPKPMIEIGDIPILIHIMRHYYAFGFNDFVICAGYRSWDIKEYFLNYRSRINHLVVDHRSPAQNHFGLVGENEALENWRVRVIDTGLETMTGARIARAFDTIWPEQKFENFGVTYGDGLSDVNVRDEFEFHTRHGKVGTLLGVPPISRFGELDISDQGEVRQFLEKPPVSAGLINGGYFFFHNKFREFLSPDVGLILERAPLERLSAKQQLMAFEHRGFWQCMDTLRDRNYLQSLWDSKHAPWLVTGK